MGVPPNKIGPILEGVRKTESYYFGCGGLADLYRGQWTRKPGDILPVAIKLIRRVTWSDKAAVEHARKRFLRESRVWSQLHHPHIVPFYGLIFEREYPGLVMPYYKNGDLAYFLRNNPQADRPTLVCEVAAGLQYLHHLKPNPVVHGDIKASNVLVTDNHQACLTDFGVAKMLSVSGYTTTAVGGTCRWMAPELLEDHEPSPTLESDIWSFGMTLLQVFTGKVPFENIRNDATVIVSLARGILPSQPLEIGDSMWALLGRCWAPEPTKRPGISVLSVVLNVLTSEEPSVTEVNDLVNYLTAEKDRLVEGQPPSALLETARPPAAEPSEKPRKKSLGSHIRKLSRDCIPSTGSSSPMKPVFSLNSLLKRPTHVHEEPSELPFTTITTESHGIFCCCWPGCTAHFTTLTPRRAHDAQHWHSWKSSSADTAPGMPGISSVLA